MQQNEHGSRYLSPVTRDYHGSSIEQPLSSSRIQILDALSVGKGVVISNNFTSTDYRFFHALITVGDQKLLDYRTGRHSLPLDELSITKIDVNS